MRAACRLVFAATIAFYASRYLFLTSDFLMEIAAFFTLLLAQLILMLRYHNEIRALALCSKTYQQIAIALLLLTAFIVLLILSLERETGVWIISFKSGDFGGYHQPHFYLNRLFYLFGMLFSLGCYVLFQALLNTNKHPTIAFTVVGMLLALFVLHNHLLRMPFPRPG